MRFLLLLLWILFPLPIVLVAQSAQAGPASPSSSSAQSQAQPPAVPQPEQSEARNGSGIDNWGRVGELPRDEPIVVSARGGRRLRCLFSGATNTQAFCEPPFFRQYDGEYHVDRAEIEQVRLDQSHRNMKIALWACTLAGAAWGAADNHQVEQGAPRWLSGLAGAGAGAMAGLIVSLPVALFVPGKLVYRHRADSHHEAAHSLGEGDER